MKKGLFVWMGRAAAAMAAGVMLVVVLFPALFIVSCLPFFPIEAAQEPPPAILKRTLQGVSVSPGTQPGDQILTLDFGAGAVDGLEKADISLTPDSSDCLLSKQGTLTAAGSPGIYTLNIGAVVLDAAARTETVTVSAGGEKAGGTLLAGSVRTSVEFAPVLQTGYKVFHLASAYTDGLDYPPTADTKLTLTLTAVNQDSLPPITDADAILISMATNGLAIDKGAVTFVTEDISSSPVSRTWELALSQVTQTGTARVEVSVDGYIQENRPVVVDFHNVSIAFNSAEEVWGPANLSLNDGTKTTLTLSFSQDIPRFTLSDLTIKPRGNLVLSNLQHTGVGEYTVDVSWGTPDNWRHEAELTVRPDDTVITPNTQKVFLSMRKVDEYQGAYRIALRRVPPGKFQRDTNSNNIADLTKAFWLGETEVTNGLWFEVMGYYPGHRYKVDYTNPDANFYNTPTGSIPLTPRVPAIDDYPVNNVSWLEAIVFCNKLSLEHGKTPVYNVNLSGWVSQVDDKGTGLATAVRCDMDGNGWINGRAEWVNFRTGEGLVSNPAVPSDWPYITINTNEYSIGNPTDLRKWRNTDRDNMVSIDITADGYRLPFHNQWLWAAMGADMSPARLSGGINRRDFSKPFAGSNGDNAINDYAWTTGNSGNVMQKAGTLKPNELGVYDLSGNMQEWLFDHAQRYNTRFFGPAVMGDNDYYWEAGETFVFSWGGSYYESTGDLSFGFLMSNLIKVYGRTSATSFDGFFNYIQQGLRVMRWVQPGE